MGNKYLIGAALMLLGIGGGVLLTCFSKRLRDVFFFVMVILAPMTEQFDINFLSRDFYRGTTRGIEVSLVDILSISLLISSVLFPRKGNTRFFWPASFGFMLLFFLYACFNVAMADPQLFGYFELSKMIRGLTIFLAVAFYMQSERELKIFLVALGVIICHEGILALRQRYLFHMHRVPGTVDDSNSLSVLLCTAAPIFVAAINSKIPKWIKGLSAAAIGLACIGVVLTISRMGVVIIASMLLAATLWTISWRITARKAICTVLILAAAGGIGAKSWKTLQERFKSSDLGQEYMNNRNLGRGYYIRIAKAIVADQTFGVGLNNWSYWVSQKYGPLQGYRFVPYKGTDKEPSTKIPENSNVDEAQAAPAHSLAALTAGEMGWPGLLLFSLLWLRWFYLASTFLWTRTPDPMRRIGVGIFFSLSALFLQSLTEWVFRHSPIYYTAHIILGVLAGLCFVRKREARALAAAKVETPEPHYDPDPEFIAEPVSAAAG